VVASQYDILRRYAGRYRRLELALLASVVL